VRSFKQVSVDRSSDGRREFELAGFLAELTQSLRLLWKHRPISLQIDCPPGITLDSFPGTLGQVLTNLAQNALLHAFAENQPGRMQIGVRALDGARIELDFSDNGRGIPPADLPRVFEPFFTTRRNSGGTGLGLHIVHNLVTQKLGGSLAIESQPGIGTTVHLRLPRHAP
jgi:signal transduction histidine kinase